MAADAMNCMQKEMEVSCKDAELRKNVGVPLWSAVRTPSSARMLVCRSGTALLQSAKETQAASPYPPCEGEAMKIGDASKCKQTEEEIRQSMHEAKEMCFSQIQECGILSV
eukprot:s1951_g11.t1